MGNGMVPPRFERFAFEREHCSHVIGLLGLNGYVCTGPITCQTFFGLLRRSCVQQALEDKLDCKNCALSIAREARLQALRSILGTTLE